MDRQELRRRAYESIARGEPTEWFEELYEHAGRDANAIPWADGEPNPNLMAWFETDHGVPLCGPALAVGCGLGDDAEELERRGFETTAFDISDAAIRWCQELHADSPVKYVAADLLAPPESWLSAFDFVCEIYTLQALPIPLRARAIRAIGDFVRPGGYLLIIARGRDVDADPGELPWPITTADVDELAAEFDTVRFDDYSDNEEPPVRRFRVLLRRANDDRLDGSASAAE